MCSTRSRSTRIHATLTRLQDLETLLAQPGHEEVVNSLEALMRALSERLSRKAAPRRRQRGGEGRQRRRA